ncbi:MAG: alkaline phosphatase family protein [Cytophagales bacterium]|nr:alkaline phosphatase family protein [Cytophagales bacterium]
MAKPFDRIITVMFENQYRSYVIQNPFLKKLASAGADMTNYFGAFHPSQTNYIASLAAEVCAVTNDTPPVAPLMQQTLVDLLEKKDVSWKAYMEAYPGDPWNPKWKVPGYSKTTPPPIGQFPPEGAADLSRYYRKHNAFASFHTIQKEERRWKRIVSDVEFWQDVANDSLPEYSWFTPDIWNDGHYLYNTHIDTNPRTQLVPQLSAWLEHVFLGQIAYDNIQGGMATGLQNIGLNLDVDLLLTDPKKAWKQSNVPPRTLLVVTFDEADFDAVGYDTSYDGPNQIYTVLLGDMIKPGTVIPTPYNHFNLIRTVEENFNLGSLEKNDKDANWFRFLWDEEFSWSKVEETSFAVGQFLEVAAGKKEELMVFSDKNGVLQQSSLGKKKWDKPSEVGIPAGNGISLTCLNGIYYLVTSDEHQALSLSISKEGSGKWSKPVGLKIKTHGSFAVSSFLDYASAQQKLMLCWVGGDGFMQSMLGDEKGFSGQIIPVGQLTDGTMTLGQVGGSLFLVYKERNTRKMRMTSYNVAPFNAFDAVNFQGDPAPENDTSLHQWAVADYPVGHFARKMAALKDEYQNLGNMTMATASGEMHLVHRGGYPDLSNAYTEIFGLTGIYTASNELTNGYGTLDQAGWTDEREMENVSINIDSPISMTSDGKVLTLVWQDAQSGKIKYRQGSYKD